MGGRDHDPVSNRIAGYLEALAKQKLEDVENGKV
jgi:ribosomal protein S17E